MAGYRIGKVIAVSGDQVFVSLLNLDEDGSAGVPAEQPPAGGPG